MVNGPYRVVRPPQRRPPTPFRQQVYTCHGVIIAAVILIATEILAGVTCFGEATRCVSSAVGDKAARPLPIASALPTQSRSPWADEDGISGHVFCLTTKSLGRWLRWLKPQKRSLQVQWPIAY